MLPKLAQHAVENTRAIAPTPTNSSEISSIRFVALVFCGERAPMVRVLTIVSNLVMWKSLSLITFIILCFVLGFGIWRHEAKPSADKETPKSVAVTSAPHTPEQPAPYSAASRQKWKDYCAQMDRNYAQAVEIYTPEVKAMVTMATRNNLGKKYAQLFAKWKLEPGKADKVLSLIHARDGALREAQYKCNTVGRSGIPELKMTQFHEMELARLQLELVLGKEQTDELCRMETERRLEGMAKAAGISTEEMRRRTSGGDRSQPKTPSQPSVFKRN